MALRMIEMIAPREALESNPTILDEQRSMGVWRESIDNELMLVRILAESDRTESIVGALEDRFGRADGFRLMLFEVGATLPKPVEEEKTDAKSESEPGGDDAGKDDEPPPDPKRIACVELVEELSAGTKLDRTFLATVVLSTAVAAIGLMRDNVAVIIGAMVIAPLLTPNMALALATMLGDFDLARRAIRVNVAGLVLALVLAVLAGLTIPFDPHTAEISSRTSVGLSDVVLAIASGCAGALAFTTGISSALVGVMVAVALLPPLATAGLLLGTGDWVRASEAFQLLAINIICVNLAGILTFWLKGIRPRHWWDAKRASRMIRISAVIWIILLAILITLMIVGKD